MKIKRIYDELEKSKAEIETRFGGPLKWERLDGKRACRISCFFNKGYGAPEEWLAIQDTLINAMDKLEKALRPKFKYVKKGIIILLNVFII